MYSNSNIQLQVMSHFFIEPCPVTWKMIGKWTATPKVHVDSLQLQKQNFPIPKS